jgi:hypothetical protein
MGAVRVRHKVRVVLRLEIVRRAVIVVARASRVVAAGTTVRRARSLKS